MKILMTLREASYHTQISERTLWRAIQKGSIIARKIGGRWFLLMEEIAHDVWIPIEADQSTLKAVSTSERE